MDIDLSPEPVLVVAAKGGVRANAAKRSTVSVADLLSAIEQAVAVTIEPIVERLDDLEARVGAAESRPSPFRYRGVWVEGEWYAVGDFCTWGGSIWACEHLTTAKPGGEHSGWRLACKSGKTGKSIYDVGRALGVIPSSFSERQWFTGLMNDLRQAAVDAARGNVSEPQAIPGSLRHIAR